MSSSLHYLPLISIIIPVYNAGECLIDCLESVTNQKFRNFEVLVVDGLSSDKTVDNVHAYCRKYPNTFCISEKDNGIYDAMNKGIAKAKGEWIYFMGSDDIFINDEVLSEVAKHLSGDAGVVYGKSILVPENIEESGAWDKKRLLNMCINHQRIFYRSELFSSYGVFDTRYLIAADYDLNIRFFTNPGIIKKYIDVPIAYYHSGGFSADKIDEPFWNDFKTVMLKRFAPYLSTKEIYGRLAFYCWYKMQRKEYAAAFKLFWEIGNNTKSLSFVKHSFSQLVKRLKN